MHRPMREKTIMIRLQAVKLQMTERKTAERLSFSHFMGNCFGLYSFFRNCLLVGEGVLYYDRDKYDMRIESMIRI